RVQGLPAVRTLARAEGMLELVEGPLTGRTEIGRKRGIGDGRLRALHTRAVAMAARYRCEVFAVLGRGSNGRRRLAARRLGSDLVGEIERPHTRKNAPQRPQLGGRQDLVDRRSLLYVGNDRGRIFIAEVMVGPRRHDLKRPAGLRDAMTKGAIEIDGIVGTAYPTFACREVGGRAPERRGIDQNPATKIGAVAVLAAIDIGQVLSSRDSGRV